ncbi:MAG: hypothetical protein ACRERD_32950 [Candidatus Binatia bacterium]
MTTVASSAGLSSAKPNPIRHYLNAANRRLTFDGFSLTSDFNGNLTSLDGDTYTWNVRNQLTGIAGSGPSASFS